MGMIIHACFSPVGAGIHKNLQLLNEIFMMKANSNL